MDQEMLTIPILDPNVLNNAVLAEDPHLLSLLQGQNEEPNFLLPNADLHPSSFMMVDKQQDPEEVPLLEGTNDKLGRFFNVFDGAGKIFDGGQTFIAWFQLNVYAPWRELNFYYPFASLGNWEIANFLLTSMLSMRAIDQWLSLGLVSMLISFHLFPLLNTYRCQLFLSHFLAPKNFTLVLKSSHLDHTGMLGLSLPPTRRKILTPFITATHWTVWSLYLTILSSRKRWTIHLTASTQPLNTF